MTTTTKTATCTDCHFRREGLCALAGDRICPTFRAATTRGLTPPRQAPLLLQPIVQRAPLAGVGQGGR